MTGRDHGERSGPCFGRLLASLSITGKVLGSPNRIVTRFEIGAGPEMHKRIVELGKARDGKETRLLEISKLLAFAQSQPGRLPPETVERARNTAATLSAEIEALRDEATAIGSKIELAKTSRVVAEQAIYEGVSVQCGSFRYRVVGEHGGCAIAPAENGLALCALSEIDLDDSSVPDGLS
ncbi:FapA family protein [Azoarcus taiwanensis]|uniref:FapA family protein n=1 Tax=Azoarcus taiwanensis TaxID=666964 RepID=UPI0030D908A1